MSVFVQTYSESDKQVVEISLDGGGTVIVEKYKDGNIKITATSKYDLDNSTVVEMSKEQTSNKSKPKDNEPVKLTFDKAKEEFTKLYFDPARITMIGERISFLDFKTKAISVGFKNNEFKDNSVDIPNEFAGFEVIKLVIGEIVAQNAV